MKNFKLRLAAPIQEDSIVDGDGLRTVIWFQGCSHNCFGCHNPESHPFDGGFETTTQEVIENLKKTDNQDGITFSGGDPFFQPEAFLEILKYLKENNVNVWAYTGYTYENLLKMAQENPIYGEILKCIDVLVEGKFVLALRSLSLKYKGSSNQRVIDIPESLKEEKVILKYE